MNKTLKMVLSISAAVVAIAGIAFLIIHFWEDLMDMLPGKKKDLELDEFEDVLE
ncbi:MAG: hypothetical protein MJ085_02590 [Clostridia bacterium]|nr:hypothetical protein [Clostridia bacterium]